MNVPLSETTSLQERVASEIRAWLARRHLSASKAAQELGWTDNYISRRLTGKIPFNLDDLEALATLLEVPVTAFFEVPLTVSQARGVSQGMGVPCLNATSAALTSTLLTRQLVNDVWVLAA